METQEIEKANGQDSVTVISDNPYSFDAPEIQVECPRGKGIILTHVLRKPELRDHLEREKSVRRVALVNKNEEIENDDNDSDANSEFYDGLIVRAFARKGKEVLKECGTEECLRFSYEVKDQAVAQMYTFWSEVEEDEDPLTKLFEREGTIVVKQEIGEEGSPSYVLRYHVRIPTKSQRQEFDADTFKIKRKAEKKRTVLHTTFNMNKGIKLFNSIFLSVDGGCVSQGEFSDELRAEYLKQIDPMFQYNVASCAADYYSKSRD